MDSMNAEGGARRQASWPLLVVAACSFLPGLGFFFAAGAVSWALLSSRPRRRLALALGVGGAVFNIVGSLFLVAAFSGSPDVQHAQAELTRRQLTSLVAAIDDYRRRHGAFPADLRALQRAAIPFRVIPINDQSRGLLHLGRLYVYRVAADGESYDLFSAGVDGIPGSADDIRPDLPDSVAARSGYRVEQ